MSRRSIASAAALLGAALTLSACQSVDQDAIEAEAVACPEGSDCFDKVEPVGPGGAITVEAGEFYFELQDGVAIDGPVEVTLDNVGGALHNFRIDQAAGETKKVEADAGATETGTLLLFGGTTYTYYCDIPGHRAQGMEGELTVYVDEQSAQAEGAFDEGTDEPTEGGTETEGAATEEPTEDSTATEEPAPDATETSTEA